MLDRLKQRSTLTGVGATLFAIGVVTLFVALYREGGVGGRGPLWAIALAILAATVVCWGPPRNGDVTTAERGAAGQD